MRAKIETTLSLQLSFQEAQHLKTVVEAGISALREHGVPPGQSAAMDENASDFVDACQEFMQKARSVAGNN